ncbi:RSC complex subunit Sfh1 [Aspergillus luchuensis]|uniref:RSC complex subunit Sfh1 n=1 Tax=Aspergillus kawachii TaxID=1069201 RepID=A0A146FX34_ASPKA|nr:RSC complex subunit Sfh1 [Aspergillus luchuensis]
MTLTTPVFWLEIPPQPGAPKAYTSRDAISTHTLNPGSRPCLKKVLPRTRWGPPNFHMDTMTSCS